MFSSGRLNCAEGEARTMSLARASSKPPPMAKPLTAAMRGLRMVVMCVQEMSGSDLAMEPSAGGNGEWLEYDLRLYGDEGTHMLGLSFV